MSVFSRCHRVRAGRSGLWFVRAVAGLAVCAGALGGSANAAGSAPSARSVYPPLTVFANEYASAAAEAKGSGLAESRAAETSASSHPTVERAISEALAPPRRRCAELRAAINQAATDANGSRGITAAPSFGRDLHANASRLPPASVGAIDKRSRLEAEYSQLKCARQAP